MADIANVKIWAEIGVVFQLFSLGLEFSFKKLLRVGGPASVTALFQIAFITTAGYFTGRWMGWSSIDSLFLGGMLASSPPTIIIGAFDELGVKTKKYARVVFGVLVVEDIVVILLRVLLSTIAVTKQFQGGEVLFTVLKLLFFLVLFLLPTLLKKARSLLGEKKLLAGWGNAPMAWWLELNGKNRILNPGFATVFKWRDIVHIAGEKKKIMAIAKDMEWLLLIKNKQG